MCIRYLKGEHADVQLMYLGSISVLGSVVLLVITQHRTFPTTMPELVLLLLTGENGWHATAFIVLVP